MEALSDIILGLLQKNRCMDKIGKSLIIKAFILFNDGSIILFYKSVWFFNCWTSSLGDYTAAL